MNTHGYEGEPHFFLKIQQVHFAPDRSGCTRHRGAASEMEGAQEFPPSVPDPHRSTGPFWIDFPRRLRAPAPAGAWTSHLRFRACNSPGRYMAWSGMSRGLGPRSEAAGIAADGA